MKLLLDSTLLIDLLRNRGARRGFVEALVDAGHQLTTSAMNIGEIYGGMRTGEEVRTGAVLADIDVFPVTTEIAQRGGLLVVAQRKRGLTVKLGDMIVAATALEHGLTLVTDNLKDFRIGELKLLPLP